MLSDSWVAGLSSRFMSARFLSSETRQEFRHSHRRRLSEMKSDIWQSIHGQSILVSQMILPLIIFQNHDWQNHKDEIIADDDFRYRPIGT
jgi:hypothetical protein